MPVPQKTTTSTSEKRRRPQGDQATRTKVLDAAVHCILELGFYRASSNAIARKAGVTWGVIQHYFGTRENLLLEVLERGAQDFRRTVADARVDGGTAVQRLDQFVDILSQHYGKPEFLAYMQILLNLDHDPATSTGIRETMNNAAVESSADVRRLLREAVGDDTADEEVVFMAVKGFLLGQQLRASMSYDTAAQTRVDPAAERAHLVRVLAPYFDATPPGQ